MSFTIQERKDKRNKPRFPLEFKDSVNFLKCIFIQFG